MSLIYAKGDSGTYPYFFCIARMRGTGCEQPYVPVELIERAVERAYVDIHLPREQADLVRERLDEALAGMREQANQEAARQRRRLARLTGERERLLHAYYAGAVPIDLLRQEQDRLATEIAQAERHLETAEQSFGEVQAKLDKALDLPANCERAYREAPGHLRRQWNQALFERLLVHDDRIDQAEVAEPFATLADPELPRQLASRATRETAASSGDGSNEALNIGAAGFEPATFRPPAERATKLRHAPGTASLRGSRRAKESGRRDSNPLPSAWKADVQPVTPRPRCGARL